MGEVNLLEQSENQVRLFVEHTPASVAMFDREMRYVLTSRRWLKDYNLGEQNIIGRSHYDVFPEIPQRWKEIHQRCLAGAVETCEQDPFPRRDGTLDWVRWEVRPWYSANDEIGGIIMFTEVITDRKRAEEELRKRDEWLRLAAEGSRLGVWYWDEVTKELSLDEATRDMFGVASPTLEITLDAFYKTVASKRRRPRKTDMAACARSQGRRTKSSCAWRGRTAAFAGSMQAGVVTMTMQGRLPG